VYQWESSDANVATVTANDNGSATLHAIAAGTAVIRVIAGSSTDSISITVGS
jgi:hypothetical protein